MHTRAFFAIMLYMSKIKNVIFDFDMTLGFRTTMWTDTVKELLLENNVYATSEQIRPVTHGGVYPWSDPAVSHADFFKGRDWWETVSGNIADGLAENGICSLKEAQTAMKGLRDRFCDIRYWKLFPDTLATLEKLTESGCSLALVSNHIPEARDIFNHLGLGAYFPRMVISSEEEYEKPHPAVLEKALGDFDKDKTVLVGDNYFADVLGAIRFGMGAVLVRKPNVTGYNYYCKTLEELPSLLKRM